MPALPPTTLPPRRDAGRGPGEQPGAERVRLAVRLRTVTPVLGGGTDTRDIDRADVIRVPTIRGHLRAWWRALVGHELESSGALLERERSLWGGAGGDQGTRSTVDVQVVVHDRAGQLGATAIDASSVDLGDPTSYALWPSRATRDQPAAPRRRPGTVFDLEVRCPRSSEREVRAAVRAWILFGGYGARTRRGAGSVTVDDPAARAEWLPAAATREALHQAFGLGRDVLAPRAGLEPRDMPILAGAGLLVGSRSSTNAVDAWATALGWLRDFRQGPAKTADEANKHAREAGETRQRPGRSNWPEADKVRQLSGRGPWAHKPFHNATPAWPRAGFGLPIIGQFQRRARDSQGGRDYPNPDPRPFELRWVDRAGKEHDRLASPLILKALPLADGRFVPCALWLARGYPDGGKVVMKSRRDSAADFDVLVAAGDTPRFDALANIQAPRGRRLRTAFFRWLRARGATEV